MIIDTHLYNRRMRCALSALFLATFASTAVAWPTKPVTLVVPYPPGGGTDVIARIVQEPLAKQLGQPVLIENRGGAGGSIGTAVVAKAAPDGQTLLFTLSSHTINPAIYHDLPFDTERDFSAITQVASLPQLFAVNSATPFLSFRELVAYIRANPRKLDYGSVGVGSPSHMAGELLKLQLDADMVHVPYRGGGPAVAAAMAGDVPLLIVSIPAAMGQVRSGRLRALAVSTAKRTPILPEVPTVAEATGLKKFEVDSWYAVFAPVKTPGEVIERSNRELATVLARTDVKAKLLEQGAEAAPSTPQALTRRVHREIAEWQALVKRVPIEAD